MRAISLFSGAGGFELGLERAGIQTVLQAESDPWCLSVLARHWPEVSRVQDVRNVGWHRDRQPDLIYGGFPCQDLSVAGARAGLGGSRSSLWHEFHRVLSELRPQWCLVENVPGLLSSGDGRDMATILGGLGELGYGWAYRILDARWFGVPQRRRRVFIVGCLGNSARAAQVLAVCESCGGHPPARREARERVAASLTSGAHPASNMPGRHHEDDVNLVVGRPLTSRNERIDWETENFLVANAIDGGERGFAPRGDGTDNLIAFQPNSSRTHDEWRVDQSPPVKKGSGGNGAVPPAISGLAGVRRLTPLECERLMGWPDEHTRYTADGKELPDSHRYRLCGNGVVAPVAEWLGHRLILA